MEQLIIEKTKLMLVQNNTEQVSISTPLTSNEVVTNICISTNNKEETRTDVEQNCFHGKSSSSIQSSNMSSNSEKRKQIAGISFILILVKRGEPPSNKRIIQYDCVLCNVMESKLLDSTAMKTHVISRKHLLHILEIENHEKFEMYKNNSTVTDATLFAQACICQSSTERIIATLENFETKRKILSSKIMQLRRAHSKSLSSNCTSESIAETSVSDQDNLEKSYKIIQEKDIVTNLSFTKGCENEVEVSKDLSSRIKLKKKIRTPSKIVLFTDDCKVIPNTVRHDGNVKLIKISGLNFNNAFLSLQKRNVFGNGSIIVLICGKLSLIREESILDICREKKCLNSVRKYYLIPGVTGKDLTSKAELLKQNVLNSTKNDLVMFCRIIPVDRFIKDKMCENNHIWEKEIHKDIYAKYLTAVEEYNEFVDKQYQHFGYITPDLFKKSSIKHEEALHSLSDCRSGNTKLSDTILQSLRNLLRSLEEQEKKQTKFVEENNSDIIAAPRSELLKKTIKIPIKEVAPLSKIKLQELKSPLIKRIFSVAQSLVPVQKRRNPSQIMLVTDDETLSLKTEEFGGSVRVIKISNLNFVNAFEILQKQDALDKGSVILLMCGISSLIKKDIINICKEKKCGNPLIKYSVIPKVTGSGIILNALALLKNILNKTSNDQIMFCNLLPVDISGTDTKVCDNEHSYKNIIHKDHLVAIEKAIAEYNEFVDEHCQLFGFKNILFHKSFLSKNENSGNSFYGNIDMQLLSDSILTGIRELLNSLKQNEIRPNAQKSGQEYPESFSCEQPQESATDSSDPSIVKHSEKDIQKPSQLKRSSYKEYNSQVEGFALQQKDRHPSKKLKKNIRTPSQIVFVTDHSIVVPNTDELGENVKFIKISGLNFNNAFLSLQKRNVFGNGSIIVLMCEKYSLTREEGILDICREKKCLNSVEKYYLIPGVTGKDLTSKAELLKQNVLNSTKNDLVMFCRIIPVDRFIKDKMCENNHIWEKEIHKDIYAKYLRAVEEYNEFVDKQYQHFGYITPDLFKESNIKHEEALHSLSDCRNGDTKLSDNILQSLRKLIRSLEEQQKKQTKFMETSKSSQNVIDNRFGTFSKIVIFIGRDQSVTGNEILFNNQIKCIAFNRNAKNLSEIILKLILVCTKLSSSKTLYLLLSEIYDIAELKNFLMAGSTFPPEISSQLFNICSTHLRTEKGNSEFIEKSVKKMQSVIDDIQSRFPSTAFCIIPPPPPIILNIDLKYRGRLRDLILDKKNTEFCVFTAKNVKRFITSFTYYSKALISLTISKLSKSGITNQAFQDYSNIASEWCSHLKFISCNEFREKNGKVSFEKYQIWLNSFNEFIHACLGNPVTSEAISGLRGTLFSFQNSMISKPSEDCKNSEVKTVSRFLLDINKIENKSDLMPVQHVYIVGRKRLFSELNSLSTFKNVEFIQWQESISEEKVQSLIKQMGYIKPKSVCLLALDILCLATETVSLLCESLHCEDPISVMTMATGDLDEMEINPYLMIKMMKAMAFVTKLEQYLSVVILPLFPVKVFWEESRDHNSLHLVCKTDCIINGKPKNWNGFDKVAGKLWSSFVKSNNEKYFVAEELQKLITKICSESLILEKNVNSPTYQISNFKYVLEVFLKIFTGESGMKNLTMLTCDVSGVAMQGEISEFGQFIPSVSGESQKNITTSEISKFGQFISSVLEKSQKSVTTGEILEFGQFIPSMAGESQKNITSDEISEFGQFIPSVMGESQKSHWQWQPSPSHFLSKEVNLRSEHTEICNKRSFKSSSVNLDKRHCTKSSKNSRYSGGEREHYLSCNQEKISYSRSNSRSCSRTRRKRHRSRSRTQSRSRFHRRFRYSRSRSISSSRNRKKRHRSRSRTRSRSWSIRGSRSRSRARKYRSKSRSASSSSHRSNRSLSELNSSVLKFQDKLHSRCGTKSLSSRSQSKLRYERTPDKLQVPSSPLFVSSTLYASYDDLVCDDRSSSSHNLAASLSEDFSLQETFALLEQIQSKLGVFGPAVMAIINLAKQYGINSKRTINMLTDNISILQLVVDKLKAKTEFESSAEISLAVKATNWVLKQIEFANILAGSSSMNNCSF